MSCPRLLHPDISNSKHCAFFTKKSKSTPRPFLFYLFYFKKSYKSEVKPYMKIIKLLH